MDIREIAVGFHVCGQIAADDVAELVRRGFGGVICNRPDHEQDGQPTAETLRQVVEDAGLAFHHIPIVPGQATQADVEAMAIALSSIEGPVLGYCRSGQRAAGLYQAASAIRA